MGRQIIPIGDRLIINMPGGGGFGNPKDRDQKEVLEDFKMGLISRDAAKSDYGVIVDK
jgi:N-methylhydantoinase B